MKVGAAMAALGAISLFLAGPMGPCGPSSPAGFPLLLLGASGVLLGWCVSLGALVHGLVRGTVLGEGPAILIGSLAAMAVAMGAQQG